MTLFLLGLTTIAALAALGLSVANHRRLNAFAVRIAAMETRSETRATRRRIKATRGVSSTHRVDRGEPEPPSGPILITVPDLAAKEARPASPLELDQRFASIWAMADAGLSAEVIARDTGQPIGQVELILGLKRPRAAVRGARTS